MAQHAFRRELDFLLLQPLAHRLHLLVELALQDQAVVDDGRDSIEQLAVGADIPGLRRCTGTDQECRHEESTEDHWVSHKSSCWGAAYGSSGSRVEYPLISLDKNVSDRFPTEERPVSSNCKATEVSSPPVRLVK